MLRQLLIVCLLLSGYIPAAAQFSFGAKAGLQVSRQHFADPEYAEQIKVRLKPGLNGGFAYNIGVTERYSLYSELIYSMKGVRIKRDLGDVDNRLTFHYVDMPLMLRGKIAKSYGYDVFLEFGANMGYWLGGKGKIKAEEIKEYNLEELHYKLVFDEAKADNERWVTENNRFQFGLLFGIGGEFRLPNGHSYILDLRYEWGHTHLSKNRVTDFPIAEFRNNFQANNHMLVLSAAYLLNFEKLRRQISK